MKRGNAISGLQSRGTHSFGCYGESTKPERPKMTHGSFFVLPPLSLSFPLLLSSCLLCPPGPSGPDLSLSLSLVPTRASTSGSRGTHLCITFSFCLSVCLSLAVCPHAHILCNNTIVHPEQAHGLLGLCFCEWDWGPPVQEAWTPEDCALAFSSTLSLSSQTPSGPSCLLQAA